MKHIVAVLFLAATPAVAAEPCATERDAMLYRAGDLTDSRERLKAAFVARLPLIETLAPEQAFVDAHNAFHAAVATYKACAAKHEKTK